MANIQNFYFPLENAPLAIGYDFCITVYLEINL